MIGIYQDNFIDYLKDNLGDHIKISAKNIICPCPWCEYKKEKDHYHMYISIEAPMFHCFHASCEQSGNLKKFLKKIEGHDISDVFVDKKRLKELSKQREIFVDKEKESFKVIIPPLNRNKFINKDLYVKRRLKFADIPANRIKGLVYDVNAFIDQNNIPIDETLFRLKDYLHSNFVGFLTEHNSTVMFRNINDRDTMRFFKLIVQPTNFLDYYKLPGNNPVSNKIVLAEGIFDIFSEHIFDSLNLKNDIRLYASVLSSRYLSLIHSIIFHEQIFQPEIIILSDRGVERNYYKKMKHFNKYIIHKLSIYYNKTGKDFNDIPVTPIKFVM